MHLLVSFLVIAVCILYTKFCLDPVFTQPQPLFVFLQSEASSNNERDRAKSCKDQSHEVIFVRKIDKYMVSFFFDDKGLKVVYKTNIYLFF